jgi:hypothetical protein
VLKATSAGRKRRKTMLVTRHKNNMQQNCWLDRMISLVSVALYRLLQPFLFLFILETGCPVKNNFEKIYDLVVME